MSFCIQETSFSRLLKCHSSSSPWTSSLKGLTKRSHSQLPLMVLDSHQLRRILCHWIPRSLYMTLFFWYFSSSVLVQATHCGKHLAVALSTNVEHVTVCLSVVQATAPKHQAFAVVAPSARHGSGRATPGLNWVETDTFAAPRGSDCTSVPKPQSHSEPPCAPRPNGISKLHLCHKHRLHKEKESSQGRV